MFLAAGCSGPLPNTVPLPPARSSPPVSHHLLHLPEIQSGMENPHPQPIYTSCLTSPGCPQPWQARLRSMQSGASPLAIGCGSLHAPESRAATPGYCAARHFRSDWAIRTTFGLTDVGINRPFWPCSVLICYGTPEAAKHPHIAFAHLDYNGAV